MKYFISAIVIILTFSCNTTTTKTATTYFGGEIINPKSNFVLLLKDDKVIDTLLLDKKSRFLNNYNSLYEGLYTFKHGNEFQYIYLEPADSVLVRLNTWDFDESLVFSGDGSAKNEFLINLFLQNEKEEKIMHDFFYLNENDFQKKIATFAAKKTLLFEEFSKQELNLTEGFKKLTNVAIHFPLYRLKEIYPLFHKKANKLSGFPTISDKFYAFRSEINLNEENLVAFYPYQNYVISYLYNLSYQLKEEDKTKDNITLNILNYTIQQIKSEEFKNTLLKGIIVNDFLKSESTCSVNQKELDLFLENCTNKQYRTQVKNLVNDSKFVSNNQPFQSFEVVSHNNIKLPINDIIKGQNSVIYFWSTDFMSSDYLVNRIKYLENEYPNMLFIGINMQNTNEDITKDPNLKLLDITKQFKLADKSFAHNYLTSKYPRTIIINYNGIVENGFTYLDSKKLNSELNKLK
ncbi:MAG: hypothetical protein GQ540_07040 [Lutibacter sp.]|uniref:hypothetical protein n=1 Tax=Lutibacter sp. TaxID=1925666 RepID=UPI001A06E7A8|nr:hypothetical protein [Lutibacter sp.]NOR28267.1 hypothetical protein [Lutibacter sp.]